MKFAALIVIFLGLTACVSAPTQQQFASADYGPTPANPEQVIKEGMSAILKDPVSAIYKVEPTPRKGWKYDFNKKAHVFGWGYCGSINAKNGFGGYTGAKPMYFLIRDSKLAQIEDLDFRVAELCK